MQAPRGEAEKQHSVVLGVAGGIAAYKAAELCRALIQRGFAVRTWPRDEKVCVRIGIHTGRPTLSEDGYVGLAVHTAARICSAGHGGQILVSSVTVAAFDAGSDRIRFRSLGKYELPSLKEPLVLFQVDAPALRRRFPALRTSPR